MKRFLKMAAIAPVVFLTACSKDASSLGLNSDMKISQIKVAGFNGNQESTILAVGNFMFVKDNPTTSADTSRLIDSFYIPTTVGYDQTLNFNTPANSKKLYLNLSFYLTNGTATEITIDNIDVDYNKKSVFNSGLMTGSTLGNKIFTMPTQTISY